MVEIDVVVGFLFVSVFLVRNGCVNWNEYFYFVGLWFGRVVSGVCE